MSNPTENPGPDLDGLFARLRAHPPKTDRHEFAFETRLLARLSEERGSSFSAWAWRLCPIFAALALAIAGWSGLSSGWPPSLEAPLTASAGGVSDVQAMVSLLTAGESDSE